MVWKLVIEDDEGKRTTVPLTRESYTIGRKEGNTIRLTERNVSRDHAKLQKLNGAAPPSNGHANGAGYALEDCSSYNGVYVNGIRVAAQQGLTHGDLIQIGDYRILIQDDAVEQPEPALAVSGEAPVAPAPAPVATRGSLMLERPNRLVMLAGPTPGMEYPLGSDRVTVGRAEDASISVNHNSVSRLHCEIHALSEGRYEIVDKGSSNGVRVNGSDLRRGIIEAGDIIELGDVRFKFVGAGQIFLPGVNDSQQLESISDRVADSALGRRSGSSLMPILVAFFVISSVLIVGAFMWRAHNKNTPVSDAPSSSQNDDGTAAVLAESKRLCAAGNCEAAHDKLLLGIPEGSPARDSADFKSVEAAWADMMLDRANNEPDPMRKQSILRMVEQTPTVDAARRKTATDRLAALTATASATTTAPPIPTDVPTHVATNATATPTHERPTPTETATASHPHPTSTSSGSGSVADQARALMLKDPNAAKNLLMPRVAAKKATPEEVTLLKAVCKSLKDYECVNMCKAQQGE